MSKQRVNRKVAQRSKRKVGGWDAAIAATESKLKAAKARLIQLERALETFKEGKEQGAPYPC